MERVGYHPSYYRQVALNAGDIVGVSFIHLSHFYTPLFLTCRLWFVSLLPLAPSTWQLLYPMNYNITFVTWR
jgi:hypothetical protein